MVAGPQELNLLYLQGGRLQNLNAVVPHPRTLCIPFTHQFLTSAGIATPTRVRYSMFFGSAYTDTLVDAVELPVGLAVGEGGLLGQV